LGFEALEGRLALSSGIDVPSHHIHAAIERVSQRNIPASFQGRTTITGSTLTISSLTGRIRSDRFTGYGSATIGGNVFYSGNVFLSNRRGSVQLELETGQTVQIGKSSREVIPVVVVAASGKYALYVNHLGAITTWNVPTKPNAPARFSGFLQG
jgi:hypothetical protein